MAIHSYLDGRRITVAEDTDEVQSFMAAWASSQERKKASQRTRDALRRKASQGYVAGGKTYGYTNVRDGSHVKRSINESEAAIVRRIFTLVAEGWGFRRIARRLTEEGVPTRSAEGWAATTLRAIVFRDLYRGIVTYGRTRTERRAGKERMVKVADGWITVEQPGLRIIDEDLWNRAHGRLARTRETHPGHRRSNGQLVGRPESGLISQHLLTGFLRCGSYGGGMFFSPRTRPNGKVLKYWLCTNHHKLGSRACANKWHLPYDAVTEAVLGHFDRITPSVVEEMVVDELARCLELLKGLVGQRGTLEMERDRLEQELGRLAEAVASGGEIPVLLEAMESRRRQRAEIMAKLEHLDGVGPDLQRALADWQAQAITLAIRSVCGMRPVLESRPGGRQLLRRVLTSPITVTPAVDARQLLGWDYVGEAALGPLMGRLELETPSNSLRIP